MVLTRALLCCSPSTRSPALDNAYEPPRNSQLPAVTSTSYLYRSSAEAAKHNRPDLHAETRLSPQTVNLNPQSINLHDPSTAMPKRKTQADAESTATPAKKTKASTKKGKNATDEDSTYILVH
jgi:hypothetical protein